MRGNADVESDQPVMSEVEQRVQALRALDVLDTAAEPEFDDLVEIAAAICEVPIGLISLVAEERQWFKASVGTRLRETPIEHSFCIHTLRKGELMVVEDAREDERFARNPFVTGENGVRFYAGVPISCAGGPALGTLCVLDVEPRALSTMQTSTLRVLARQVDARLELRSRRRATEEALAEAEEMRRRLSRSQEMFRSFMDNGPFHAFVKSAYGTFLYYNQPLAQYLGLSETELLGGRDGDLWPGERVAQYRKHDLEVLRTGKLSISEETVADRDGRTQRWRTFKFPCTNEDGQRAVGAISQDVTAEVEQRQALERSRFELEEANGQLTELAGTDALTGLPNRRVFDDRLAEDWILSRCCDRPLCVAMFDLDSFKRRNDVFGHAAGDAVLKRMATLVKGCVREEDLLARYGGEEFALVLPDATEEQAQLVVARILQTIRAEPWEFEPVTASFGIACSTHMQGDQHDLVQLADEALYAAKRAGKDRAVLSSERVAPSMRVVA